MTWWHYLLLSNLYLIMFYGFYALLLRRETFFQLNRIYLIGSAVMSFLIPIIQLDVVKQWFITQKVQQTIYSAGPAVIFRIKAVQPDPVTLGEVIGGVYIAGIVVLSLKLVWQLMLLSRIMRNGQVAAAWSFFKKIKVDEQLHNHRVILAHEEVHARQWHSADVLLIELIMILNWFNPVAYLYRSSIKHIHEFIADRDALKAGASRAEYAMLLLSQTFNAPVHHLLNPFFNNSVLKQRILMLQKNKSHYSALLKYGFSAPLFALMLALSSATLNNSVVVTSIQKQAEKVFAIEAPLTPQAVEKLVTNPITDKEKKKVRAEELQLSQAGIPTQSTTPVSLSAGSIPVNADSSAEVAHNEVFTSVEKLPSFAGGMAGFHEFLGKMIRYPAGAREHNQKGRVIVTFVVEQDGSLSDVKAINNPGNGLAEEAVRAISASPKWVAGEQNGRKVRVQYTVPVVFTTDEGINEAIDTEKASRTTFNMIRNVRFKPTGENDTSKATKKMLVTFRYNERTAAGEKPLIYIDGKEMPPGTLLTKLDTKNIESINVLKDEAATRLYGEKSKDGVVVITTKKQ
ncbi:TonB family protein [Mucilaginibacter sp. PAMB04168]|uniref:TonB family protein n=1 Tax=Mucilaginibacter sp. PAMB04168 TaxID=3138567 RepID=UPI0031F716AE